MVKIGKVPSNLIVNLNPSSNIEFNKTYAPFFDTGPKFVSPGFEYAASKLIVGLTDAENNFVPVTPKVIRSALKPQKNLNPAKIPT